MMAAGAGHGIGRTLLGELLFANWAGFRHHVSHNLGSMNSTEPPVQLRGILHAAGARLFGRAIDPVPAQHTVREIFDLGHRAVSWTLAAIHDSHGLSVHRKPPFASHLLMRQSEEKKAQVRAILQINSDESARAGRLAGDQSLRTEQYRISLRIDLCALLLDIVSDGR
jgi:hypothetical protein